MSPVHFVLATRDAGYKSTALAVAEFIDNSVQAGARLVSVEVGTVEDRAHPIEVLVVDDGCGMDAATLSEALTFGGSSRFGDRRSLGRYGMGLPNGALSRARRVEVYTWQTSEVLMSRLDVDEVVSRGRRTLPPVERVPRPAFVPDTISGTAVRLVQCDRLEYKRVSALVQRLEADLGRIYRRFLSKDLKIRVNGRSVEPVDPLFLLPSAKVGGAKPFGDVLTYELVGEHGPGRVDVRFSELPIDRWHGLSSKEKRLLGITNAPPVSILRAGREIDRGWYFMGKKRRENYDDWWRCEVSFEPALDEFFGIAHSKQAISPSDELLDVLAPDLEPIARALNNRVRHRFELVKVSSPLGEAEKQAARAEASLPALPRTGGAMPRELRKALEGHLAGASAAERPYLLMATELPTTAAFEVATQSGQLIFLLNVRHPLYRDLYGPLAMSEQQKDQDVAKRVVLAVLAAARAELVGGRRTSRGEARRFRQDWGDVLATFFNA